MKPRTIFSAVAAVCLIMIMILPRLAASGSASAPAIAQAGALPVVPLAITPDGSDPAAAAEPTAMNWDVAGEVVAVPQPTTPPVEALALAPKQAAAVAEAAVAEPAAEVPALEAIPYAAPPDPSTVPATAQTADGFPALEQFAASLVNGQAQEVVGFYAPGLSALPVRQQPGGNSDYISDEYGTVTQYHRPSQHGVVGLLAHNTLSGREFFYLGQNQDVYLVYGDGHTARFRIQTIQQYQALSPYDTRSDFVDLSNPSGPVLSHSEVYQRVYTTNGTLVLQTCIEANGEPTWGRLFVIATPI